MIVAPSVVAVLSIVLFFLCLKSRYYAVVSQFACGGMLSLVCFLLWLANLIITMHSEDSWAVNGIGEIKVANLYYFTWAGGITAGLQMMSFVSEFFGHK